MTNPTTQEIREQYERAIRLATGLRQDDPDYWLRMVGVLLGRLDSVRKVAGNRSMLNDYEAQYIYSALGDFGQTEGNAK